MVQPRFPRRLRHTLLRAVSLARLEDAWTLLENARDTKRPQRRVGAVYLAGYAVECAIKFRICLDRDVDILEERYFSHDLTWLLRQTGRFEKLEHSELLFGFKFVESQWTVALRYQLPNLKAEDAQRFFFKAKEICQWLFIN